VISIKLQLYLKTEEFNSNIYIYIYIYIYILVQINVVGDSSGRSKRTCRSLKDVKSCCKLEISNFLKEL